MVSVLFSPLDIGPVRVPNRIAIAPMCQYSADDGCATDWHLQLVMNYAMSGAGTVILEATGVTREGRISHGCLGLYSDDCEAALSEADSLPIVRKAVKDFMGLEVHDTEKDEFRMQPCLSPIWDCAITVFALLAAASFLPFLTHNASELSPHVP